MALIIEADFFNVNQFRWISREDDDKFDVTLAQFANPQRFNTILVP